MDNHNDDITDPREITDAVHFIVVIHMTLAMSLHHRLGEQSPLNALWPAIVRRIAHMASFSFDPFYRLCQEIMFDCRIYDDVSHELDCSELRIFTIFLKSRKSKQRNFIIRLVETYDYDENTEMVSVEFQHLKLHRYIVHPEVKRMLYNRNLVDIKLRDPRKQQETFVENIEFDDVERSFYSTRCYKFPLEYSDLGYVVDLLLYIISPKRVDRAVPAVAYEGAVCPRCGAPMGEGGMPDALCTNCSLAAAD
jgi:hypothetical protein